MYPLGGDASRWHGVNFGRRATDEWERAAALHNVPTPLSFCRLPIPIPPLLTRVCHSVLSQHLQSKTVTSEPGASGSEHDQPSTTLNESENLAGVQRSAGSEGSADTQRKASLKEKISGGMKVVSGKLGHDKGKVEEGKKLMHGQSA